MQTKNLIKMVSYFHFMIVIISKARYTKQLLNLEIIHQCRSFNLEMDLWNYRRDSWWQLLM